MRKLKAKTKNREVTRKQLNYGVLESYKYTRPFGRYPKHSRLPNLRYIITNNVPNFLKGTSQKEKKDIVLLSNKETSISTTLSFSLLIEQLSLSDAKSLSNSNFFRFIVDGTQMKDTTGAALLFKEAEQIESITFESFSVKIHLVNAASKVNDKLLLSTCNFKQIATLVNFYRFELLTQLELSRCDFKDKQHQSKFLFAARYAKGLKVLVINKLTPVQKTSLYCKFGKRSVNEEYLKFLMIAGYQYLPGVQCRITFLQPVEINRYETFLLRGIKRSLEAKLFDNISKSIVQESFHLEDALRWPSRLMAVLS